MHGKENMSNKKITQPRAMQAMYALTEKRPIDLSLSENPLGCSPMVSDALKRLAVDFNNYPSPNGRQLRKKLSKKFSISENSFFVANGSESIINDLPKIFCQDDSEVIVPELTFPMFAVCSKLSNADVVAVKMTSDLGIDLPKIIENISKQTRMIFLCNPNNPTGSILSKNEIIEFIEQVPSDVLVVVDEANIEFGGESVISQVADLENLIVLRTLSKGFGLATLRIGFAVANNLIIQKMEEETPIFQISGISEQLACVALEDEDFIQRTRRITTEQRVFLKQQLLDLGFFVFSSEANNLFVKLPLFLSAKQFVKKLGKKGVSVVLGSNFDGYEDSFFRVSVRDVQTNKAFIQKMKEIIKETV